MAVYIGALAGGFVYDDVILIQDNPWVHDLKHLPRLLTSPLWASWIPGPTNYFRPVPMAGFSVLWSVSGGAPVVFHGVNLLLHALATGLVGALATRVSRTRRVGMTAALVFAVHPLGSEAVCWIACLPELTYTSCVLAALYLHQRSRLADRRRAFRFRAAAAGVFLVGLFSKESAVVLLALVGALELGDRQRGAGSARATRLRGAVGAALPYLGVFGIYLAVRVWVVGSIVARHGGDVTVGQALLNAPVLLARYLLAMLLPARLSAQHVIEPVQSMADPQLWGGLVAIALMTGLGLRLFDRRGDLFVAWSLAWAPLVPVLYIPFLGNDVFSERYAYLALAGFAWLAAGGLETVWRRIPGRGGRRILAGSGVLLLVLAGARTAGRTADWRDHATLGRATIRAEPRAEIGYALLGNWHAARNRPRDALSVYREGLSMRPHSVLLATNVTKLRSDLGEIDPDQAAEEYRRLEQTAPGNATIPFNLASACLRAGRLDEAQRAFQRALELSPADGSPLVGLAAVADRRGDHREAIELCRRALEIDPAEIRAHEQIGMSYLGLGDLARAIPALELAISLGVETPEALNRLGVAYVRAGRTSDARVAWQRALDLDPTHTGARRNLDRLERMQP